MNLSFSTNGWKLSFDELLELLSENKIFGLELHDVSSSVFGAEKPFSAQNISTTKKKLFEHGVTVSCIDAVGNLADGDTNNSIDTHGSDHIDEETAARDGFADIRHV